MLTNGQNRQQEHYTGELMRWVMMNKKKHTNLKHTLIRTQRMPILILRERRTRVRDVDGKTATIIWMDAGQINAREKQAAHKYPVAITNIEDEHTNTRTLRNHKMKLTTIRDKRRNHSKVQCENGGKKSNRQINTFFGLDQSCKSRSMW